MFFLRENVCAYTSGGGTEEEGKRIRSRVHAQLGTDIELDLMTLRS